jgi:hypothetical protein
VCIYLMQAILRERSPLVHLQRITLGLLAVALIVNTVYPEWMTGGHRIPGVIVNLALVANLAVMAMRGRMIFQRLRLGDVLAEIHAGSAQRPAATRHMASVLPRRRSADR